MWAEFLVLTDQTYTSVATLNMDLAEKEGILKQGNGTASITINGVMDTNLINIETGTLAFSGSGGDTPSFHGTINVSSGATITLSGHDTLGYTPLNNTTSRYTVNLAGAMQLDGDNQSFGNFTLNLQGGTVSGTAKFAWLRNTTKIQASSGNSVVNVPISFDANVTEPVKIDVANGASLDFQQEIGMGAYTQFVKTGEGILRVSKPVLYNVLTKVEGGTFQLGGDNILQTSGAGINLNSGAFFNLNGNKQELKHLQGSGTVINSTAASSTLTMNLTEDSTFSGSFGQSGQSALSIVQKGDKTWTLDGTRSWYIDTWNIESGTAAITKSKGGAHYIYGTIAIAEGAKLALKVKDALGYESSTTKTAGKGYTLNIGGTLELHGENQTLTQAVWNFTGGELVQAAGQGTTVDYLRNYTEINAVEGDSRFAVPLKIGSQTNTATLRVDEGASLAFEKGIIRREDKSIHVHKTGEGTLIFTGTSPYCLRETNVSAGMLILDGSTINPSFGSTTATVLIEEGAQFFATAGATIAGDLNLQGEYVLRLRDLDTDQTSLILNNLIFGDNAVVTLDVIDVVLSDYQNIPLLEVVASENLDSVFRHFSALFEKNADASYFNLSLDQNTIYLSSSRSNDVPEPSAWLLLLIGLGGVGWCRKMVFSRKC